MWRLPEILFVWAAATVVVASPGRGAELYVGVAEADITPAQPMALWGQMHTRISKSVESPVTAQVVALELREGDRGLDAAIMVSADIIGLPHEVLVALRKRVVERLPDFDAQKLFVSGTHIHTGPVFREGDYKVPKEGVIQPAEYAQPRRSSGGISGLSTAMPTRKAIPLTKSKSMCSAWATWRLRPIPSNCSSISASKSRRKSRAADVCRAVGRRRGILADLAGGARRRVQRHCREQHGGPGGRAGTRRPHRRPGQVAVAGAEALSLASRASAIAELVPR